MGSEEDENGYEDNGINPYLKLPWEAIEMALAEKAEKGSCELPVIEFSEKYRKKLQRDTMVGHLDYQKKRQV